MADQIYFVIQGAHDPYTAERDLVDCTWDGTVRDIADMQFKNLRQVLEVGTGRDITTLMVKEAIELRAKEGREPTQAFAKLVELTLGTRAARPFFQRAA